MGTLLALCVASVASCVIISLNILDTCRRIKRQRNDIKANGVQNDKTHRIWPRFQWYCIFWHNIISLISIWIHFNPISWLKFYLFPLFLTLFLFCDTFFIMHETRILQIPDFNNTTFKQHTKDSNNNIATSKNNSSNDHAVTNVTTTKPVTSSHVSCSQIRKYKISAIAVTFITVGYIIFVIVNVIDENRSAGSDGLLAKIFSYNNFIIYILCITFICEIFVTRFWDNIPYSHLNSHFMIRTGITMYKKWLQRYYFFKFFLISRIVLTFVYLVGFIINVFALGDDDGDYIMEALLFPIIAQLWCFSFYWVFFDNRRKIFCNDERCCVLKDSIAQKQFEIAKQKYDASSLI